MRKNRLVAIWGVVILGGWVVLSSVETAHGYQGSAKARLAKKGIRATRSGFSLLEESEFSKSVAAAYSLKRKFAAATHPHQSAGSSNEEAEGQVEALTQQNQLLRNKLSQINANGFAFRGEVVRQINQQIAANEKEITLIQQTLKQSAKSAEEFRQNETSTRQAYVNQVTDARELADRLIARYAELNQDKEALAAMTEWNEAAHTSNALKPSRGLESAVKRLEALEEKIDSQKIPLRQKGKSYNAMVIINGEKACEMAVDTAAPTLLLPYDVAVGAGVKVNAATETTTIKAAGGSEIQAKRVLLKSVRVGSFTAKNVLCDVFPPRSTSAKAVLGKSFLGQFKGELNAGGSELSLARVDAELAANKEKEVDTETHVQKIGPARPD